MQVDIYLFTLISIIPMFMLMFSLLLFIYLY